MLLKLDIDFFICKPFRFDVIVQLQFGLPEQCLEIKEQIIENKPTICFVIDQVKQATVTQNYIYGKKLCLKCFVKLKLKHSDNIQLYVNSDFWFRYGIVTVLSSCAELHECNSSHVQYLTCGF